LKCTYLKKEYKEKEISKYALCDPRNVLFNQKKLEAKRTKRNLEQAISAKESINRSIVAKAKWFTIGQ